MTPSSKDPQARGDLMKFIRIAREYVAPGIPRFDEAYAKAYAIFWPAGSQGNSEEAAFRKALSTPAELRCDSEAPDDFIYCNLRLGHRGPCSWEKKESKGGAA